jgi:hypothetical protein
MLGEVLQINEAMDYSALETQLALQCAPVLTGIKLSNLLIIQREDRAAVIKLFKKTVISCHIICEAEDRVTFLLYHKAQLQQYINEAPAKRILHSAGYHMSGLDGILRELTRRYSGYIRYNRDTFPHEIGIFLGYPAEDVAGFMENRGKNYLYIGYWKVYGNLPEALRLFEKYRQAKEKVLRMISQGASVRRVISNYSD